MKLKFRVRSTNRKILRTISFTRIILLCINLWSDTYTSFFYARLSLILGRNEAATILFRLQEIGIAASETHATFLSPFSPSSGVGDLSQFSFLSFLSERTRFTRCARTRHQLKSTQFICAIVYSLYIIVIFFCSSIIICHFNPLWSRRCIANVRKN